MKINNKKREITNEVFETMPIAKALFTLAIPTIISQIVVVIYNLADTYFIGLTNDPYKIAAASMCTVLFFLLNAFGNLFGIGGGSLISRLLGENKKNEARNVCSFSIWSAIFVTLIYCLICFVFMEPILKFMGASINTIGYCKQYVLWAVVIGGIPASLSLVLSNILRSEGHGTKAGLGLTIGGLLNLVLDPLFMFVILPSGLEVLGAALATCCSNLISLIYYLVMILTVRKGSVLNMRLKRVRIDRPSSKEVFVVGIPSAIGILLVCVSIMVTNSLVAKNGDIPVAALGIVMKINMLPHNMGMGLSQGMIPLVAYNYASHNYERMKKTINLTRIIGVGISLLCVFVNVVFAKQLSLLFIKEVETLTITISFLKIMTLADPFTIADFHALYSLQAMGKGKDSLILSCLRQGLILIPLLYIMDYFFGMYGVVWGQFIADGLTLIISIVFLNKTMKKLETK